VESELAEELGKLRRGMIRTPITRMIIIIISTIQLFLVIILISVI